MHNDKAKGTSFPVRWRGYDRRDVDASLTRLRQEVARLREELEVLRLDRDGAVATADDLIRELEDARSEIGEYRVLHAGYSKDNAVSGCIRYLMHVARQKADAFETDARERSEQMLKRAEEVARQQAVLLDETEQETQRRLAEAEQRAREIVDQATAEARALLAGHLDGPDRWTADTQPSLDVPMPRLISGPLPVVQPEAEEQRPTTA
ncbi:DivIVA domain-containing protein [Saccharothrix stipae]